MRLRLLNTVIAVLTLGNVCSSATAQTCEELHADVLIVGAGIAGVTAARELYENGITDIVVLEARSDKIGGRIRSAQFAGATVELGANWIQHVPDTESERNNQPLWKLAMDTPGCSAGLVGHFQETAEYWDRNENNDYFIVNSEKTDPIEEAYVEAFDGLQDLTERLLNNGADDITIREAFQRLGWNPTTALENLTEWYYFDYEFAEPPDITSLFGYYSILAELIGENNYFVYDQRGLSTIVDCIARGIESKIQLGAMVNNITWNDECVCASVTRDGMEQTMCGKYGVTTFSVGVLQDWINSSPSKFMPQLSSRKQDAINDLRMAYYLKIFLEFNETFWNDEVDDILRTDARGKGYFPLISSVGQFFPNSPHVLLLTVTESEAVRISNQDEKTTQDEVMVVLREIYGNDIPDPIDILIPTWINDPLYRGMYSNTPFGSPTAADDRSIVREPVGNLYLTGEAVSDAHFGYMHGGYCEGLATGDLILQKEGISRRNTSASSLPPCPSSSSPSSASSLRGFFILVLFSLLLILFAYHF